MSSQARQDEFVLSLIDKGTFLDVGCWLPEKFNNTKLLEDHGWTGLAVDIKDYSKEWETRATTFEQCDVLTCDWDIPMNLIDYLSLDIEGSGNRFRALERLMDCCEFKIITVEHDRYLEGHLELEAKPQRELLTRLGYFLLCKDVRCDTRPFEDWWINPKYFDESEYMHMKSDNIHCRKIKI